MLQTFLSALDIAVTDDIEAGLSNFGGGGNGLLDGWPKVGVSAGQFVVGGRVRMGGRGLAWTRQRTGP